MTHYTDHVKLVMQRLEFQQEAVTVFDNILRRLDNEEDFAKKFDLLTVQYLSREKERELDCGKMHDEIKKLAAEKNIETFSLDMVFLLCCSESLLKRYLENSLTEEFYWEMIADLKYKLDECIECDGVWGNSCWDWYRKFFTMQRFTLGRFQYQLSAFDRDYTSRCGYRIKSGTPCVHIHIPASGIPLTDDVRYDSYKKAHKFLRDYFTTEESIFCCHSWLLYPKHPEFLPPKCNILKFFHDFEIINSKEEDGFDNDYRVFGRYNELPYDQLPTDTSLRKAYAEWLMKTGKSGNGDGLIIFDGERIINK